MNDSHEIAFAMTIIIQRQFSTDALTHVVLQLYDVVYANRDDVGTEHAVYEEAEITALASGEGVR